MTTRRLTALSALQWAILLALVGWLFRATLAALFDRWWDDPSYTHGLLVPFVSAFFLGAALRRKNLFETAGSLWGVPALLASVLLFLAGRLGNMLFIQALAFIASLAALALLIEGREFLRLSLLPLAYLIFMCPLPSGLYDSISAHLRLFASQTSTILLQLAGVPATASGNIIDLPNATLSVEDACSGIRSLFGILATSTAFAFVVPSGLFRKLFFILSAAPIAVFTNILRVTGMGLLQHSGYERLAQGFYHQLEGWVFYLIALLLLWAEYAVLQAVFPTVPASPPSESKEGVS